MIDPGHLDPRLVHGLAAADFGGVIGRYDAYGPLLASFLANTLATFGDKGQLVVVTLASRYDARKVFLGAMAAFSLWSAVEVLFGQWIVRVIPGGVMTLLAGGLFLLFGLWTLRSALDHARDGTDEGTLLTEGGIDVGLSGRVLPETVLSTVGRHDGIAASFLFILLAEFGDKTQLLTINLAATFDGAPLAVFVGVVAALGLRTGIDALVGERFERLLPTEWLEAVAAAVFVAFGLFVLGAHAWLVAGAALATAALVGLVARR